ncbi:ribosome associated membrane RAMP4 [Ochromonadaceae sp. CCMP2298]|nr:ribosome associated membrane RAMP4 [Ochromonadaceae sp. CCMP2298]
MSSRATRLKSDKYNANIAKRGKVIAPEQKRDSGSAVSPLLLGFFFFVLVGSTVFQIIRNAQGGPIF